MSLEIFSSNSNVVKLCTLLIMEKKDDITHHFYLSCLFRELVQSIFPQKKILFHSWFKLLLLFCVLALGLCYTLSSRSLSLWQSFPFQEQYQWFLNQNSRVNAPAYRIHPKNKVILNKTTEPSTVRSTSLQYHQAYPRNYHFLMDNTEVCKNKIPFLVLMVPVEPKNVAARDAIRQTWGKENSSG